MSEWVREPLHPAWAQSLRVDKLLYDSETEHQRIRVFENETFGRVLTLDDVVQTTEGDNHIYHEMMAHVPIFAHGAAADVLIIGAGATGTGIAPFIAMTQQLIHEQKPRRTVMLHGCSYQDELGYREWLEALDDARFSLARWSSTATAMPAR